MSRAVPSNSSAVRCAPAGKQQGEGAHALSELSPLVIFCCLLLQPMHMSKCQFRQPARLAVDRAGLAMAQLVGQERRSGVIIPRAIRRCMFLHDTRGLARSNRANTSIGAKYSSVCTCNSRGMTSFDSSGSSRSWNTRRQCLAVPLESIAAPTIHCLRW